MRCGFCDGLVDFVHADAAFEIWDLVAEPYEGFEEFGGRGHEFGVGGALFRGKADGYLCDGYGVFR